MASIWRGFFVGGIARSFTVNFLPMTNEEDEYDKAFVFDSADQSIVTHAIFPEFSEFRSTQRLTNVARVIESCQPLLNELHDSFGMLRVEVLELPRRRRGNLNRPGHIALSASLAG